MDRKRTLAAGRLMAMTLATAGLLVLSVLLPLQRARAEAAVPFPTGAPWYNVSRPLTLADLRGRAVLLDFFTPGCINCIHMVPVEKELAGQFGDRLVIIAVDSPKFAASATTRGLVDFLTQYHVEDPALLDAQTRLWNAYGVEAWPTFVLIGPRGNVRNSFIGEQTVSDLAGPIQAALAHAPPAKDLKPLPRLPLASAGGPLDAPGGLAVSRQWVAVADTAHNRIVLADHSGKVVTVIGDGCAGSTNGSYGHATFARPHGLAFDNGKLYVADTNGQVVRAIDLANRTVGTIAGSGRRAFVAGGDYALLAAPLNSPWDVEPVGDALYVAMAGDHDIWRLDFKTKRFGPWAGSGREGLTDGDRRGAEFAQTSGLTYHAGTLYAADPESSSIRAIDMANGRVTTLIGHGLFVFGDKNGPMRHALLQHAEALVWLDGSLYIADTFNNTLRRLDLAMHTVSTVAGHLDQPDAVAALSPDTLLVAEASGDRIDAVHLPNGKVTPWPLQGLKPPPACPAGGAR